MRSSYLLHVLSFITTSACLASILPEAAARQDTYLLSEQTHRSLTLVHRLMDQGEHLEALDLLQTLESQVSPQVYEHALLLHTMGYVYHALGQNQHAIASFQQALDKNTLPREVIHNLNYNLAQLLISAGNYIEGIRYLERWLGNESKHSPDAYFLAATAYYNMGQYAQALRFISKAISDHPHPPEAWYQLKLSCHYALSQYTQAENVLETLIRRFPAEETHWIQLAGVYQRLKRDGEALAILELAHHKGLLNQAEIIRLARLYLFLDMPFRAAQLLETALNKGHIERSVVHWTLLADSLLLAQERERSIIALRKAAELSDDGQEYARLGQVLFELERWQEAMEALEIVPDISSLRQSGSSYLLLGIAAYHTNDRKRALTRLKQAQQFDATQHQAEWWLGKLDEK